MFASFILECTYTYKLLNIAKNIVLNKRRKSVSHTITHHFPLHPQKAHLKIKSHNQVFPHGLGKNIEGGGRGGVYDPHLPPSSHKSLNFIFYSKTEPIWP